MHHHIHLYCIDADVPCEVRLDATVESAGTPCHPAFLVHLFDSDECPVAIGSLNQAPAPGEPLATFAARCLDAALMARPPLELLPTCGCGCVTVRDASGAQVNRLFVFDDSWLHFGDGEREPLGADRSYWATAQVLLASLEVEPATGSLR